MLHQLNPLGLLESVLGEVELTFNPCFHPFLTWTGGLDPATERCGVATRLRRILAHTHPPSRDRLPVGGRML